MRRERYVLNMARKEYGKLTADQFRRVILLLPELQASSSDLSVELNKLPAAKLKSILGKDYFWARIYEVPFSEHVAWLLGAMGKFQWIAEAVQSPDPQQFVLDSAEELVTDSWDGGEWGIFQLKDLIRLVVAGQRSILSIMVYGRSLSALVEEVRGGNDESLFAAVRIDRSILACPTFADRIAKAEILGDRHFFVRLRAAFKGLSGKQWAAYHHLRYALAILREMDLDSVTDAQLEKLMVADLGVYANVPGARKNLRKHYAASRKFATT